MIFRQFYLNCLAHASYLIGSEGEAVVVDPQRDVEQYTALAETENLKIRYIIETHLHADFVSGHRELANRTGAEIVFGRRAEAKFPHRAVQDGDCLKIGTVSLKILETPGHTPESICILVQEENSDTPARLLTGDTLFIGDVGRPDLAGGKGFTTEQMASMMYDSLREKILKLPNETEVYPAHGAGSACGKNISQEKFSTIAVQKLTNYALKPMSKEEFVRLMTTDLPPAPMYFAFDAEMNRRGAKPLAELQNVKTLSPEEVDELLELGAIVLDVRDAARFGAAHVFGSINIGLKGQFASWCGSLIPSTATITIVADNEAEVSEAVTRLARVGLENVAGYLDGGIAAWREKAFPTARIEQISVAELRDKLSQEVDLQVVDVRRPAEYISGHVPTARNASLIDLHKFVTDFDSERPTAVICAGGYRSSAATSILEKYGFRRLYNITGGTSEYIAAGYETETQEQSYAA
jgi:glyoxylase-like metal-dependent hydrolase (beta-lactamase superfamily II)/rhodanese-related sulfurtransferase